MLSLFVVFFVGPVFVLSATLILVMADNVDEIMPAAVTSSPQATASVPLVEFADESAMTPSNPTMAALFDIVRARSSASVAPPLVPVVTPSGYVSFTGVVRHASNVATNDPADVIGSPASSFDRLMKSVLQREDWAECARVSFSWDDISRVDDSTRLSVGCHRRLGRNRSERWFRCSPDHDDSRDAACVSSCPARRSARRYVIVANVTLVVRNRDPRRAYPYGTDVGSGLRVRSGSCSRMACA